MLPASAVSGNGPYNVTLGWASSAGWGLTGNSSTSPGTNFIGTTDNQAFEIHVYDGDASNKGSKRVMRYESASSGPNIIGGYQGNSISGANGSIVAGGGSNNVENRITGGSYATISGGDSNIVNGTDAVAGCGHAIRITGSYATIPGG